MEVYLNSKLKKESIDLLISEGNAQKIFPFAFDHSIIYWTEYNCMAVLKIFNHWFLKEEEMKKLVRVIKLTSGYAPIVVARLVRLIQIL